MHGKAVTIDGSPARLVLGAATKNHSFGLSIFFISVKEKLQFKHFHVQQCENPHLFLSLDLDADLQPDGSRHAGLVRPLLQVVPDVHLARERPDLDDRLAEEVVRLAGELLTELRLQVVVLVPNSDLDPVRRVVALAVEG